MDIPNILGLSNLISNDSLNAEDIIQQSANNTNFFVLTAGQTPPDPARLLSSQRMQELIRNFQKEFDLVIIDTPPLGIISDAKFLTAHTDGLMMVVRINHSDRSTVREVLDGLKISRTSVIGIVTNGEKRATSSNYHYYHRYYGAEKQKV
jgi:succinoglycan biosynthesis transport protein ExoP